jgi:predicted nucleic acid-binding protein
MRLRNKGAVANLLRNGGVLEQAGDASYLHLARIRRVQLVTLDRQLAEAAEKLQCPNL